MARRALAWALANGAVASMITAPPHAVIPRGEALAMVQKRRPPVEERVVPLADLHRFSAARATLDLCEDACAVVDADLNLFVVSARDDGRLQRAVFHGDLERRRRQLIS